MAIDVFAFSLEPLTKFATSLVIITKLCRYSLSCLAFKSGKLAGFAKLNVLERAFRKEWHVLRREIAGAVLLALVC